MEDQTYTVKRLEETFEGKDGKEHKVYLVIKVTCYGVKPRTTDNITDIALADDIEIDEDRFFLDPVFNEDGEVIDSAAESEGVYGGVEKERVESDYEYDDEDEEDNKEEENGNYGYRFMFAHTRSIDDSIWYDYDQDAKSVAEELELGVTSDDPFNRWEGAYVNLTDDLGFIGEVLEYRKEKPETYFYVEGDGRFLD